MTITSFWCDNCKEDLDLPSLKGALLTGEEYFWALCSKRRCGKKLIRRISDRKNDPYFRLSRKVRKERDDLKIELLQPSNPKFQRYYKEQWDKIEENNEKYEQEQKKKKLERDDWYKNNKFNHQGV